MAQYAPLPTVEAVDDEKASLLRPTQARSVGSRVDRAFLAFYGVCMVIWIPLACLTVATRCGIMRDHLRCSHHLTTAVPPSTSPPWTQRRVRFLAGVS